MQAEEYVSAKKVPRILSPSKQESENLENDGFLDDF